jgi:hypothetical protein
MRNFLPRPFIYWWSPPATGGSKPKVRRHAISCLRLMSGDFANLDPMPFDIWNRGVIGDAEKDPTFERASQFFAALLQSPGVGPDTGNRRNLAEI